MNSTIEEIEEKIPFVGVERVAVMVRHLALLLLIIYCCIANFSACSEKEKEEEIPFVQIAKDGILPQCCDYCAYLKISAIFKNKEGWESFNKVFCFSETEIDFDKYIIIAVIGEFKTFVYTYCITSVTEYSDRIVITVTENNTKGIAFQSISQPYHIIKIPIIDKKIEFKYIVNK